MMIVLHTLKYGDTSLIVHGYTQEEGRVSFILRGAFRSSRSRSRTSAHGTVLLHPLSIVNYETSRSSKGSMAYLREFSPKYRLNSIREDFDKISIAMFISELLYRTLLHSERDEELYAFLFLDRYAAFLGFPFERGFNLDFNPFTPEQTDRLRSIHEASFEDALSLPMTGAERKELIEAVIRWLEFHTGSRIDLRSLSVLHQLSKIR